MVQNNSGKSNKELNELREKLIVPTIKNIVSDLEQQGWYCVIGDLNPFENDPPLNSLTPPNLEPSCFTSLLTVDIEHSIAQYVYVFFQNDIIRIIGDESSRVRDLSVELNRANDELEGAIRKVIDLGV